MVASAPIRLKKTTGITINRWLVLLDHYTIVGYTDDVGVLAAALVAVLSFPELLNLAEGREVFK